ncbi:MAG: helix-turn-helix domain-containing protein [Candidatus Methylumidiphilus sp.]
MLKQDTVPSTCLDLANLPEHERFSVWKESISVIFDVTLASQPGAEVFSSSLTTRHLGSMLLSNTVSQGQFFRRSHKQIGQDGLDHFLVQIYQRGRTAGVCGNMQMDAKPGDVLILDLSQSLKTQADDFDNLTLVVPRQVLCRYVQAPERFHGRVLPKASPLGRLLSEHLFTLWAVTPKAAQAEANAMAEGAAGLAAAYFSQAAPAEDSAEIQAATRQAIRQFIARHFADPRLEPDFLAARFHISRAQLYRLFKPYGGVTRHIQEQRLAWCLAELSKPANRQRRIFDIAARAGFTDEAHFSRAFRQAYGISPKEARQGVATSLVLTVGGEVDRSYEDWLRKLGGVSLG